MPNSGGPVPIRRSIPGSNDPYSTRLSHRKAMVCEDCGAAFHDGRWHLPNTSNSVREAISFKGVAPVPVVCPACHRIRDDVPAGVVVLSGDFLEHHTEEILNLIANESERAMKANPLHRVMHVASGGDGSLEAHTTSDKLAQQIGKALHKAYSGDVKYRFVQDSKLARVTWQRSG